MTHNEEINTCSEKVQTKEMEIEWNSKVVELCKTAHYAMLDLVPAAK
jgi:hypothetical protein